MSVLCFVSIEIQWEWRERKEKKFVCLKKDFGWKEKIFLSFLPSDDLKLSKLDEMEKNFKFFFLKRRLLELLQQQHFMFHSFPFKMNGRKCWLCVSDRNESSKNLSQMRIG